MNDKAAHDRLAVEYNKLTGKYRHYCFDWDGMGIDETCVEFLCCYCELTGLEDGERDQIKDELRSRDEMVFRDVGDGV